MDVNVLPSINKRVFTLLYFTLTQTVLIKPILMYNDV